MQFYFGTVTSDLSGGADFSRYAERATGASATISIGVARTTTETSYMFSRAGVPNNSAWSEGSASVKVKVNTTGTNIYLSIRLDRISSTGTVLESSDASPEVRLNSTGVKTLTVPSKIWTPGSASDRLRIAYLFRNSGSTTQTPVLETNTANTLIDIPGLSNTLDETNIDQIIKVPIDCVTESIHIPKEYEALDLDTILKIKCSVHIVNDVDGYRIERKLGSAGEWKQINVINSKNTFTYDDAGPFVAGTYFYRLCRTTPRGDTSYSNVFSIEYSSSGSPTNPPSITIVSFDRARISDETGVSKCTVVFTSPEDLLEWEARADGAGVGQGLLVGNGGTVSANTETTFDVDFTELTSGDKPYRINVYARNEGGWTEYGGTSE